MTHEERERLRALCDKATLGTWVYMGDAEPWSGMVVAISDDSVTPICSTPESDDRPADMDFIRAARTALPELLDEVEAAEAQLREVVGQAKQQLRDEQEASGVDLGKMMRRQDRMVAEMMVLRQRAEAAEAQILVLQKRLEAQECALATVAKQDNLSISDAVMNTLQLMSTRPLPVCLYPEDMAGLIGRLTTAEAKVMRLREYIRAIVVQETHPCHCFPCMQGRRLLEETK